MSGEDQKWLDETLSMVRAGARDWRRFSAVLVRDGEILGAGRNAVRRNSDPTEHAEIMAIRDACQRHGPHLSGAVFFASAEPCPMCLTGTVASGVRRIVFAATAEEAAKSGYDYGTSRRFMHALQKD